MEHYEYSNKKIPTDTSSEENFKKTPLTLEEFLEKYSKKYGSEFGREQYIYDTLTM